MLKAFADGKVFGAVTGGNPPRVFALHGWGRSHADFREVLAGLDAVALDLPGFGASPPPPSAWGGGDYAEMVAAVMDETGAGPAVVLGHSFGGQVAVHLAAAAPDRVLALVLTGTPLLRRPKGATRNPGFRLARWLHRRGLLSDARIEELKSRHGSPDYRAASGVLRDVYVRVVNEAYDEELGRVECPVELVWGELDRAASAAMATEAADLLRDARLQVLPGVGHFTPQAAPGALRAAIDEYLT